MDKFVVRLKNPNTSCNIINTKELETSVLTTKTISLDLEQAQEENIVCDIEENDQLLNEEESQNNYITEGSDNDESETDSITPTPKKKRKREPFMLKTKYLIDEFKWIDNSKHYPFCSLCRTKLSGGRFHLKRHEQTVSHIKLENAAKNSLKFPAELLRNSKNLSKNLLTKETELRMCAYICEHRLALSVMDTLPLFCKAIFPDSDIVKNIKIKRKKATKMIVDTLAPALKEEIIYDLKRNKFSIIIDESTDVGTKKALVVIVRYWKDGRVQDRFLNLIELTASTAEVVYTSVKKLLDSNGISYKNVIGFAADNANTMMGHLSGVQQRFKEIIPNLFVQRCTCHSLHLCASAAANTLPNEIEQLTRDIYSYFSNSSKRCQQLSDCQIFAQEKPHKMLRPSQTRWLSLRAVVDRILEQWNSLIIFFQAAALDDNLPAAQRILNNLSNQIYKLYLLFLSYILEVITKLNLELQSEQPKLPVFLEKITSTYKVILKAFIKKQVIQSVPLQNINVKNPDNYVSINDIYFGAKADAYRQTLPENYKQDIHNFKLNVLQFYIELSKQIQSRFDFDDKYLKFAAAFTTETASSGKLRSIANFVNLFPDVPVDIELVNIEWQLLGETNILGCDKDMDLIKFWKKVENIKNNLGEYAFSNLMTVVKVVLSLPHSSAAAERVFSQMALTKTDIRNKLAVKTCSAILQVNDMLKNFPGGSAAWKPEKKMLTFQQKQVATSDSESE